MVQQLSLFGSLPQSQHKKFVQTLSALTGAPPKTFKYNNILIQPDIIIKYEPNSKNVSYEQFKLLLKNDPAASTRDWVLQQADIPVGGKRKVNTQSIIESLIQLNEVQSIDDVITSLNYTKQVEFVKQGELFFFGDIIIEISQILKDEKLINNEHLIKCFINVEKSTDVELLNKSGDQLLALKMELSGLVELDIPDRNSMDSRANIR